MDSLNDILSRVVQNASEKVAQRIQPAINRRPLRDPQTDTVGFFQDFSAAVKNIRSPEVASALQSRVQMRGVLDNQSAGNDPTGTGADGGNSSEFPSSSPAVNQRRTNIGDDAQALGTLIPVVGAIVKQVATAGKAIGEFGGNTTKLDKAVTGIAQTVVLADKEVKASKPAEGLTGWLRSFVGPKNQGQEESGRNRAPESAGETISGLKAARSIASRGESQPQSASQGVSAKSVISASPVAPASPAAPITPIDPTAQIINALKSGGGNSDRLGKSEKSDTNDNKQSDGAKSNSDQLQPTSESASIVQGLRNTINGFVSSLTDQNQRRDSFGVRQNIGTSRRDLAGAYQWGSWPKKDGFGMPPSSPAEPAAEKPEGKTSQWLNSSSLADGFRNLIAKVTPQRAQFTGGSAANGDADGGSPVAVSPGGFVQNSSSMVDIAAAKAMNFFRQISRRPERDMADDENEQGEEKRQDQQEQIRTPRLGKMFENVRQNLTRTIGRQGRRILAKNFRQRVQRGQNLIRGRVKVMPAGGSGSGAPPAANSALSWPKGTGTWANGASGGAGNAANGGRAAGGFFGRMFGGGGGAAAGGGGGGGAAAGGAAGGGMATGGMILGGLALGAVALIAVVGVVVAALAKLGMQGYETALRVAQFDGQLSAAKAQLDVSRLMRDIGTARTLSEAGAGFMKSLDKLEAALRPITDGGMKVGLEFMTLVIDGVVVVFQNLIGATVAVVKAFDEIDNFLGTNKITPELMEKLENMAAGKVAEPQNLPVAGFHDEFLKMMKPAAPPRPPLPPLGGGN